MSDFFCRRVFRSCLCAHFPYMHYVTISANQNQRLTMIYAYGRHSQKNDSEGSFELSANLNASFLRPPSPPNARETKYHALTFHLLRLATPLLVLRRLVCGRSTKAQLPLKNYCDSVLSSLPPVFVFLTSTLAP